MEKTQSSVSYKTKNYQFDFDTYKGKTEMIVYDLNNNLLFSLDGLENINALLPQLQIVLKDINKDEACSACAEYQLHGVAKACPKHKEEEAL